MLDLVLTTDEHLVTNLHTTTGISDHDIVYFNINVTPQPKRIHEVWKCKKADPESAKQSLQDATEFSLNQDVRSRIGTFFFFFF